MALSPLSTGCPTEIGDNTDFSLLASVHGIEDIFAGFSFGISPRDLVFAGYADVHFGFSEKRCSRKQEHL